MGTILLAAEGINLFLAGAPDAVRAFLRRAARRPALRRPGSQGELVRTRSRFGSCWSRSSARSSAWTIRPSSRPRGRAPAVDAPTLKRWLDQGHDDDGRPVVLLDTRNAFEVDHGTIRRRDRLAHRRSSASFPARCDAHTRRTRGQDRGELLHRRHPLREGRDADARGGRRATCWQLEGGILQILRGGRRRALSRQLLRVRRTRGRWTRASTERRSPEDRMARSARTIGVPAAAAGGGRQRDELGLAGHWPMRWASQSAPACRMRSRRLETKFQVDEARPVERLAADHHQRAPPLARSARRPGRQPSIAICAAPRGSPST